MKTRFMILSLAGAVLLAGCSSTPTETSEEMMEAEPTTGVVEESMVETTEAEASDAAMMEAEADMTIDMFSFGYSEETITASPGDSLTIKLTNSKGMHDFVIDELDVKSDTIQQGEETMVTIEIPEDVEPGTEYEYYCSVGNHREQGMVGTLMIE